MRMVQVAVHQIVDVIAMGHGLMPAAGAMHMPLLVAAAVMGRGAAVRIRLAHLDHMLVHMARMHVVEVAIMQIVHMVAVAHRRVAAAGAVLWGWS